MSRLRGAATLDDLDRPRRPLARGGHVESWFWRANHPRERRAIWLKATTLRDAAGRETADAWCTVFQPGVAFGLRSTVPLDQASIEERLELSVSGCSFGRDRLMGDLSGPAHAVSWELRFLPMEGPLGAPLHLLPPALLDAPIPRNKTVTPCPAALVEGEVVVDGERWVLDGWPAMRGHNWGPSHAPGYAWGHALFLDEEGRPHALVEGVSARLRRGERGNPWFSALVIRRGASEVRFDRVVDLWRQRAEVGDLRWSLRMRGRDGEALLMMEARAEEVAALGYTDPGGALRRCLNSKLSEVELRVNPRGEDGFTCRSPHGGALEFLRDGDDPRWPEVV